MGVVYRARHVLIDRVVALKLIRPDLRGETHLRAWMLREARAANRVDHAHIIDIHDIGETEEGELYLVMEYLVGTLALEPSSRAGPMPLARAVDILEQMCAALARAHDLGVVHRDLKSDNILLTHARRPEGLRQDPRLRPRAPRARSAARAEGRGLRHARVHVARAGARRRGRRRSPISTRSASSSSRCSRGSSPSARTIATRCSRCSARAPPPKPRAIRPDAHPQAEAIVAASCSRRTSASATRTPTISRKS